MSLPAAGIRFPVERALLRRTRLAYVHLRNLLTDAKRDRAARVYGYVAVWLPEEMLLLYLQEGEVVNATGTVDGAHWRALPISEAIGKVPNAAEIGEICFHEVDDEQLAAMYWSQAGSPAGWPPELHLHDAGAVLGFLNATMHDGVVEVHSDGGVNYAILRAGRLVRAFFADRGAGTLDDRFRVLLESGRRGVLRLWPVPRMLPVQAPPALIQAYRDLMATLVRQLLELGARGAPAVSEHARQLLAPKHPALECFSLNNPHPRDPVAGTSELTLAIAVWLAEILWASTPSDGTTPERLIADLTHDRRHVFQSAGLFEALPWKVER